MNKIRVKFWGEKLASMEDAQDIIAQEILSDKPSMVARFGSTEIKAVLYPHMSILKGMFKDRIITNMKVLS